MYKNNNTLCITTYAERRQICCRCEWITKSVLVRRKVQMILHKSTHILECHVVRFRPWNSRFYHKKRSRRIKHIVHAESDHRHHIISIMKSQKIFQKFRIPEHAKQFRVRTIQVHSLISVNCVNYSFQSVTHIAERHYDSHVERIAIRTESHSVDGEQH